MRAGGVVDFGWKDVNLAPSPVHWVCWLDLYFYCSLVFGLGIYISFGFNYSSTSSFAFISSTTSVVENY